MLVWDGFEPKRSLRESFIDCQRSICMHKLLSNKFVQTSLDQWQCDSLRRILNNSALKKPFHYYLWEICIWAPNKHDSVWQATWGSAWCNGKGLREKQFQQDVRNLTRPRPKRRERMWLQSTVWRAGKSFPSRVVMTTVTFVRPSRT